MNTELITMIADSLSSLLEEKCTPARLREYESTCLTHELWGDIETLGFTDLMLPERDGGADLNLASLCELLFLFGQHLLPVPLADTIVARAMLHNAGKPLPTGAIVLASFADNKQTTTMPAMYTRAAQHALIERSQKVGLIELEKKHLVPGGMNRSLGTAINAQGFEPDFTPASATSFGVICAALRAAEMAGMLARVLELTVAYVNERSQFGKKIGRFQAIQQQIAVLAEEAAAARMAAKMAFAADDFQMVSAATAKMRAGSAAKTAVAIAHAAHGAMGFSEEYDLQLYSRRLIEARLGYGSDSYWSIKLGAARMADAGQDSLNFVRENYE